MRQDNTYIRPGIKSHVEPRRVQNRPENDRHEKWERRDSRIVETVEGAQATGPAIEEHRATGQRIEGGVDACENVVEAQTPVCQPGEVAEGLADSFAVAMGAVPAPDEEDGHEDVERNRTAENSVGQWWEEPGGFEAVLTVKGWVCAHKAVEGGKSAHFCGFLHVFVSSWSACGYYGKLIALFSELYLGGLKSGKKK
ncbi:unnamed protein product [Aspergillus oryzae]|nr:unnamed protein product [Aspergillus oryzae]GMF88433.1 unnamed protein product [Aspergillus oryzae]